MAIFRITVTDRLSSKEPYFALRYGCVVRRDDRPHAVGSVASNNRTDAIRCAVNEARYAIHAERLWRRSKGIEELIAYARGAAQSGDSEWNARCVAQAKRELARRGVVPCTGQFCESDNCDSV